MSFRKGEFPLVHKMANVFPIFKKGDKQIKITTDVFLSYLKIEN